MFSFKIKPLVYAFQVNVCKITSKSGGPSTKHALYVGLKSGIVAHLLKQKIADKVAQQE